MNKEYDIIIFGASGFTGELICNYLSQHKDKSKIRWAISGRNSKKLNKLSEKYSINQISANSFNQESLNAMCAQTELVISTVGPYDIYGEKLVKACINNQSHYLDLTGEPSFVKKIYNKYAKSAKNNNVIIMHCCGFESIPPDLGTYLTVKELDSDNIDITYYLKTKGKISGGTWASFLNSITSKQPIIDKNRGDRKDKVKKLFYSNRFKKWALFFPVIDKYIVMKSSKAFNEYGNNFSFKEYILLPSLFSAISLILGIGIISIMGRFNILRKFLLNRIPSGQGPSLEEQKKHWFKVTVIGKTDKKEVETVISGGDPGYGETSKFISEMALCILLQKDSLIKKEGILTPVECSGDLLKERLINANINISTSKLNN